MRLFTSLRKIGKRKLKGHDEGRENEKTLHDIFYEVFWNRKL